ncbi:MAG: AEC family transporter [Proteobacteria bacterium]|nr:AEC family transporter [Pseudomonadota bacterium]
MCHQHLSISVFAVILSSLLSVFLVITLGWALRRYMLPDPQSWIALERITYFALNPVLIFLSVVKVDLASIPLLKLSGALLGTLATLTLLLVWGRNLLQKALSTDGPGYTSLFQGIIRWNGFIALAVAGSILGTRGIALVSVAMGIMIPVINVISVSVLKRHGNSSGSVLKSVVTNPFVISGVLGLLFNLLAIPLPKMVESSLSIIGQCALGCGLIVVGAGLHLEQLRRPSPALVGGTLLRLIGAPLIAFGLARALNLPPDITQAVVICFGVPTAANAYLLARQMGGDAPLMAAIITAQTIACLATLPLLLFVLA